MNQLESNFSEEEIKVFINLKSKPVGYDIDRNSVKKFSKAIGDNNPIYSDEIFSRSTNFGTIVIPPTFLQALRPSRFQPMFPEPFSHILDAGSRYNFYHPIRMGDRISVVKKIIDIYTKEGRLGTMLFRMVEVTYTNQLKQTPARQINTIITYGLGKKDPGLYDHC